MRRRDYIFSLSTAAALAGCTGSEPSDESPPTDTTTPTETATPTPTEGNQSVKTLQLGEVHTTDEGLEITVDEIETVFSVPLNQGEDGIRASPGNALVFAHLTVRNNGDTPVSPPTFFQADLLSGSDQYGPLYEDGFRPDSFGEPVSGKPYDPAEPIHPGIESNGWIAFEVPHGVSEGIVAITNYDLLQYDTGIYWETEIDTQSLPSVNFVGLNAPETVELGDEVPFEVVANNTGGSAGQFRAEAEWNDPTVSYNQTTRLNFSVDPDTQQSQNYTLSGEAVGNATLWIGEESETVEIVPATVDIGIPYETPSGVILRVQKPTFSKSYSYSTFDGEETVTAPSGKEYVMIYYRVENPTEEDGYAPTPEELVAVGEDDRYPQVAADQMGTTEFTDPIIGEEFSMPLTLDPGEIVRGLVLFEVDASLPESALGITAETEDLVVHWQ